MDLGLPPTGCVHAKMLLIFKMCIFVIENLFLAVLLKKWIHDCHLPGVFMLVTHPWAPHPCPLVTSPSSGFIPCPLVLLIISYSLLYSKTCLKRPLKKKTDYCLMQVKSIAGCSKRAFCNTFDLHYATIYH